MADLLSANMIFFALLFSGKPFVGASVGYFSFLFLLAGRALTVSYSLIFNLVISAFYCIPNAFMLHEFIFVLLRGFIPW